jgi:hypothetical protein
LEKYVLIGISVVSLGTQRILINLGDVEIQNAARFIDTTLLPVPS